MAEELTTADVYETASIIGQDFEKLIDEYGHEAVVNLMPKIVRILEQMEAIVADKEKQMMEIAELKMENERLYSEIRKEASLRRRLDEELYQIRQEDYDGKDGEDPGLVTKLKEENQKLKVEVEAHAEYEQVGQNLMADDIQVMHKMKETIDQQRDVIRSKNSEANSLRDDIEAMEEQIVRLTDVNQGIRRQMNNMQKTVNDTIKEKTQLQAEMQGLLQELDQLRNVATTHDTVDGEEPKLENGTSEAEEEDSVDGTLVENQFNILNHDKEKEISEEPKNPDRPRFTLKELQRVLWERDLLKMQVYTLEEELSFYKPSDVVTPDEDSGRSSPVKEKEKTVQSPVSTESPRNTVQRESGISKFFHLFWRDKNKMSTKSSSGEWEVVDTDKDKDTDNDNDNDKNKAENSENAQNNEPSTDL